MTDMRKALEEAREFVEEKVKNRRESFFVLHSDYERVLRELLARIDAALAAPGGEPVAWRRRYDPGGVWSFTDDPAVAQGNRNNGMEVEPLYRHPEAGEREGVRNATIAECAKIADQHAAHDPNVIGNSDERVTHRHCAMDIAGAIRALASPTGEKA